MKKVFLLLVLIIVSCTNDNDYINTQETAEQNLQKSIVKTVTLQDIPLIKDYINNKLTTGYKIPLKVSQINNSREPDVSVEIETEEITQTTNEDDISNYNFKAKYEEHSHELSIINYVISEKYDGTMYSYITIYKPDPTWFESKNHILDINTYTGEIVFFNYEGSYVGTTTFSNGIQTNSVTRDPCDDGTTGGGGGSTGGTAGGPGNPGGPGGSGGGGSAGGGTVQCTCVTPPHNPLIEPCTCDYVIITIYNNTAINPDISTLLQRGPCDDPDPVDPCDNTSGNPCGNNEIGFYTNVLFDPASWTEYQCQKSIVQQAYNVSSPITDLFQDIFIDNLYADVTFYADPTFLNYGRTIGTDAPGIIPITFGLHALEGSDLLIATVAIHEIFHANLYYLYKANSEDNNPNNDFNIPAGADPSYTELVEAFAVYETGSNNPIVQHNFIATYYKDKIAQGVYNWATTVGGYPQSSQLLEDLEKLAWIGLQSTSLWNQFESNPANQNEVSEINQIISEETVDQGYAIGNFCD